MSYSPADVFKPNAFPDLTYVSRSSGSVDMTNEDRLRIACRKMGFLTYVTGMPKTGKTVLCQKVIPFKDLVSISGAHLNTDEDVWSVIRRTVQMPVKENKASATEPDSQKQATFDLVQSVKEEVIAYFKQNKKILLIDDFQKASFDRRKMLAFQLKDAIGKGLQVVVVSSSDTNELLRLNPDLSGRISMIKLRPWKNEDLKTIAKSGFEKLGVICPDELMDVLVQESRSSPQRLQAICLKIGNFLQENGDLEGTQVIKDICQKALGKG